jgi:alkylation response protein AidB-like acyl-CoA dehydrogenase
MDWRPYWQKIADAGVLGLVIPEEYGGAGHGTLTAVRALQRLGETCRDNGFLLAINGQLWAMQQSFFQFGTEAQRRAWLPGLIDGSVLCCHAVTEATSGSDAMSLQTRAEKVSGGYRITGEKIWIGMAPGADLAQVFAVTRPDAGAWGLSAFMVDLALPGVVRGKPYEKVGHRTVPAGDLSFDGVVVPEDARLGPEGAGQSIFLKSIDWERRFIFSGHVGAMRRQLRETAEFARQRAPGGTPIARHQSVSNRLADMHLRYETSRLLLENAARELDAGTETPATAPLAKLHISEALLANAEDAMRIHGGAGYRKGEVERMFRDAAGAVTLGGTSDIQRRVIAAMLQSF